MKSILALLTTLLLLISTASYACVPISLERLQSKQAKMFTSKNGRYLVKDIPGIWVREKGKIVLKRAPYRLAFEILKGGQLKQIWSMKSNYAEKAFISDDGKSLLTLQNPREYGENVLTLFNNGRQVKSYTARTFGIQQNHLSKLPCGGRHAWIHRKHDSVINSGNIITIRTVNGSMHKLDLRTGAVTP